MNGFTGIRPRKQVQPASISQGGTGATTRVEAVAALGVPTLDGNNTFTGANDFQSASGIRTDRVWTDNDLTLATTDTVTIDGVQGDAVLDTSAMTGVRLLAFPDASGTLALVGGAIQWPYSAQGSTYAASRSDGVINCSGTFTVTLPTAVGFLGQVYVVKNSGAGAVTVAGTGGQTFDGAASVALVAGGVTRVCSDGANWLIL